MDAVPDSHDGVQGGDEVRRRGRTNLPGLPEGVLYSLLDAVAPQDSPRHCPPLPVSRLR